MAFGGSLQLPIELGTFKKHGHTNPFKVRGQAHLLSAPLSSHALRQDLWSLHLSERIYRPMFYIPYGYNVFTCQSFAMPSCGNEIPILRSATSALTRSYNALYSSPLVLQIIPAVGIIAFAVWGLEPLLRHSKNLFFHRNDSNSKKSTTYYIFTSYLQPLLLWIGTTLICRLLDPVILPSVASQAVKQRLLNFVRSLSTVLAFAYCLSSLIQQTQKFFMETNDPKDARNVGFQFAGKALYTAVWVAAVSLFMELLGFSTQKWLTAGGLGTVLITLAGREIFTNFLSSVMIHATRPFVINEWIQTRIEGYEVSGTVEHVGWWSPSIIRGEDREAVHIPNHQFTVNIVRNLSQKTHWRIKTYLAISHLDVKKINNIVADMRKVLAKNPQVEQQRLHRRVFLENINPENQALLILVSCFVKTSHFEEYLCVKEAILLDLLRVISHHRARLATPMRTIQKIYSDADVENVPFAETVFTHPGAATNRPLLLIEPLSRVNGEDKAKGRSTSRINEEESTKTVVISEPKAKVTATEGSLQDNPDKQQQKAANSGDLHSVSGGFAQNDTHDKQQNKKANSKDARRKDSKVDSATTPSNPSSRSQHEGLDSKGSTFEKGRVNQSDSAIPLLVSRPPMEENIVLGVALDGAKRTLPIEEGMGSSSPNPVETKELASSRNGTGTPSSAKDKKDGRISAVPGGAALGDQQDQER